MKPEKIRASTGFEPVTSANTGAMLYQLRYEATHRERAQFIEFIFSRVAEALGRNGDPLHMLDSRPITIQRGLQPLRDLIND